MTTLWWTFLLISAGTASPVVQKPSRSKRGLVELAGAIKCTTGRPALAYLMYGCYCGLGGQGWPRDTADWCCHKHDCCYGDAEFAGCDTKAAEYQWTCINTEPDCVSLNTKCDQMLCECDHQLATCLQSAPYDSKNALWPNFLCGSEYPTCNIY
ncbi:group 10 secretory phospholipase A2 [Brachyhypopomus gauderio]|uniref:group 10 secretory phospholipase A2 n=1 Tax=Brachyhypopomus gauderio TaxID=698409 RepID=UPI0040421F27